MPGSIKMTQKLGAMLAALGAVYLVLVAWMCSWWYVPAYGRLGPQGIAERAPYGGTAFLFIWGISGVLGAILVAVGAAVYSAVGRFRLALFVVGSVLLVVWLAFWSATSYNPVLFGVGGGVILFVLPNLMSGLGGNAKPP